MSERWAVTMKASLTTLLKELEKKTMRQFSGVRVPLAIVMSLICNVSFSGAIRPLKEGAKLSPCPSLCML